VVVHLHLFIDFFVFYNFVVVISHFFVAVFICGYWEYIGTKIVLLPIIIIILTNSKAIVATIIFAAINYRLTRLPAHHMNPLPLIWRCGP